MSAPDTGLARQKRRHIGPLAGIAMVLGVVAALFFGYLAYSVATNTTEPTPAATPAVPGAGLPAEGAPATPLTAPEPAPQVIEPAAPIPPALVPQAD